MACAAHSLFLKTDYRNGFIGLVRTGSRRIARHAAVAGVRVPAPRPHAHVHVHMAMAYCTSTCTSNRSARTRIRDDGRRVRVLSQYPHLPNLEIDLLLSGRASTPTSHAASSRRYSSRRHSTGDTTARCKTVCCTRRHGHVTAGILIRSPLAPSQRSHGSRTRRSHDSRTRRSHGAPHELTWPFAHPWNTCPQQARG